MKDEKLKNNFLEDCVTALLTARIFGIAAGLDMHFISEIDHLVAAAKANRKEEVE